MRKRIHHLAVGAASLGLVAGLTGNVYADDTAFAAGSTLQADTAAPDATAPDASAPDASAPWTIDLSEFQIDPVAPPTGPAIVLDDTGDAGTTWIGGPTTTIAQDAATHGCDWYRLGLVFGGEWHESVDGCSLVGTTDDAWHGYQWYVDGTRGSACVHGRGYKLIGGSWTPQWVPLGCGKEGGGQVTIGKVYTVAKVRGLTWDAVVTGVRWQ
ncbi:hypothetical protein [Plantibacter sp. YIM 135347]|uniref:hypothetical protein n=1 Tax=Plantibacter sp. YIM 135347 TaxID=3423919 RepID=UPI003D34F289